MIRIGKYEFADKQEAEVKIKEAFEQIKGEPLIEGQSIYETKHAVSHIGNYVTHRDLETGEVIAYSENWAVDICFVFSDGELAEEPESLEPFAVEIDDEGVHGFAGISYQQYRFNPIRITDEE